MNREGPRRASLTLGALLLIGVTAAANNAIVQYEIEVELEPGTHRLYGSERIRWSNTTSSSTDEVWLHLYLNAFASSETTLMRELEPGSTPRGRPEGDVSWGWIRVTRLRRGDGTDLLPTAEFVRPDDGNPADFTVMRVQLGQVVMPGASVDLLVDFEAQLPGVIARTGYAQDFHMVGQWFPKLGVYEEAGMRGRAEPGWNCHQFHAASEFYADFGSYRVAVEVPDGWVVAASGVEVERTPRKGEPGRRVVFRADQVHDFAWCAAPAAVMEVIEDDFNPGRDVPQEWLERAHEVLGLSTAELELPPIHLRLLVPRTQLPLVERMIRAVRLAIAWHGLLYGPYPYPQLTVVSPPPGAGEAGGMEYPTLITTGANRLHAYPPVKWSPWIELVTVHEFGHQYFYGLLGSNEFEEAWLDEGLTSYCEASCVEALADRGVIPRILRGVPWAMARVSTATLPLPVRIDREAWRFRSLFDYYRATFDKGSLVLRTLERLVGAERFARAMRTYVERYRFRHPTIDDLSAVFSEETGEDLGWYFDQAVRGDATVDWAVLEARSTPVRTAQGLGWDGATWKPLAAVPVGPDGEDSDDPSGWQVEVHVARLGEFVGPVEVAMTFADGDVERRTWDGRERWARWSFPSAHRLTQVVVDPDGTWALEVRRRDNYWRGTPQRQRQEQAAWWLRETLQMLHLLHLPWS